MGGQLLKDTGIRELLCYDNNDNLIFDAKGDSFLDTELKNTVIGKFLAVTIMAIDLAGTENEAISRSRVLINIKKTNGQIIDLGMGDVIMVSTYPDYYLLTNRWDGFEPITLDKIGMNNINVDYYIKR